MNDAELYDEGVRRFLGNGVPQDRERAAELFTKAAERGHAGAKVFLAYCYEKGEGVPQNIEKAVSLYSEAAEDGNVNAQYAMGQRCLYGIDVPEDPAKAAKWHEKAADQGHAPSQNVLGHCYTHGIGVEKDPDRGLQLFFLAAIQGNAEAQYNYAICCELDDNPNLYLKTPEWLFRSARQGFAEAQYALGERFEYGKGLPQDPEQAAEWYSKAMAQGHKEAEEGMNRLLRDKNKG